MKKRRLIICFSLILVLIMNLLVGCSKDEDTKQSNNTKATDSTKQTEAKRKVLTIMRDYPGVNEEIIPGSGDYFDSNWTTRYVQENFGDPNNIDVKWDLIHSDTYIEKLTIKLASNSSPDIFYVSSGSGSFITNMVLQGGIAELSESVDKYGSNLKKQLGEDHITTYGTMNGGLYAIPGVEDILGVSNHWMRKDWLDKLGLDVPETFDEWYTAIKMFKDEDPGNLGDDVIPFGTHFLKYPTPYERIVTHFIDYESMSEEDYYAYSGYGTEHFKPGFKEGIRFLNQMYNDGLISPEFALDGGDYDILIEDITTGKVGSFTRNILWPVDRHSGDKSLFDLMKENVPDGEWVEVDCFTNKYTGKTDKPVDNPVLSYVAIPASSEVVDEAVMYLDWLIQPEQMFALQYGIEGVTYDMVDGVPVFRSEELEARDGVTVFPESGVAVFGRQTVMMQRLPGKELSWKARALETTVPFETSMAALESSERNGFFRNPPLPVAVEAIGKYVPTLRKEWQTQVTKMVMCSPEEFDQVWEEGVKAMELNGAVEVAEGKRQAYIDHIKK
ncbi:extracellular solute-binding protein [Vallitalea okinawensis]|uniref:extracellular solute-binding protein n=1 Tax=Vallitalea okinawensis TaxID=2078660 RepID=UPI000CFD87DF|nr:extracellular solute-binding protein [Vallitalea okinawensis]